MDEDRMLTASEVGKVIGGCRATVFAYARDGKIPPQIKIGRLARWSEKELRDWIKASPRGAYGVK